MSKVKSVVLKKSIWDNKKKLMLIANIVVGIIGIASILSFYNFLEGDSFWVASFFTVGSLLNILIGFYIYVMKKFESE